jgi:acyl carrier protein
MDAYVEPRVRRVVAEHLGVDVEGLGAGVSITDDLAADSLDLLELGVALEEAFGVDLPRGLPPWVRTVGELVELVYTLVPARQPMLRVAFIPPPDRPVSTTSRTETLTPYAVETIAEDALHLGPGTALDVTVDDCDDLFLARVRAAFAALPRRGVAVTVHRPNEPGARPHPHAA